jgi:hypothetical protein
MVGWPELVRQTAQAYRSLPSDQQANTMIDTGNYGEADAIDYYGRELGLPKAVSPHLTYYYYWAPPRMDPATLVLVGFNLDEGNRLFGDCRQAGTVTNYLGVRNEEYGSPILICSNLRRPLWSVWGSLQTLG